MRKSEKVELTQLLMEVRTKFRPMEIDKMTIGEWKTMDDRLSRMIVKIAGEVNATH